MFPLSAFGLQKHNQMNVNYAVGSGINTLAGKIFNRKRKKEERNLVESPFVQTNPYFHRKKEVP